MSRLKVDIIEHPDHTVVRLRGSGLADSFEYVQTELMTVLEHKPQRVVVDMSELSVMDSLLMGALMMFRGLLKRSGGAIALVAPQPRVLQALENVRLSKILPIFTSLDAAIKH